MQDPIITFPMFGEGFRLNPSSSYTLFGIEFYWYGAIIALGFVLAFIYVSHYAKEYGLTSDNIIDVLIIAVPAAIIFARLYYVVFNLSDYKTFLDVINIRNGGLAVYGGVIGGVFGGLIYSKVKKVPLLPMMDDCAFGLLIGQAIGRWGNFINREAFGAETDLPWKMGLETAAGTRYYHPAFLYESLWNVLGFLIIHFFFRKKRKYDGEIFLMYAGWYGFGRMIIEGVRMDSLFIGNTGIRASQLLASVSFAAAVALLLFFRLQKPDPAKMYINSKAAIKAAEETEAASKEAEDASADSESCGVDIENAPEKPEEETTSAPNEEEHH